MIEEARSLEREFYKETLFQKLKKTRETLTTSKLYLEQRAADIVYSFFSNAELFGTGLTEVFTKETVKAEKEIGKAVVVAVLDDIGQSEIQSYLPIFSDIFIINLTISSREATQGMKVSPIKKKLRGFLEISLNFFPFIDTIYNVNRPMPNRSVNFVEGFTSYLTSFPKFHQYQISFSKTSKNVNLASALNEALNNKLNVLLRHECPQYKQSSSPRIKILLIDRKLDQMSPLIYSYFYGPVSKELGLLDEHPEFTIKSPLFSTLYSMDIQEASEFLMKLSNQKASNKKDTLENSNVQQIKKAITIFCDNTASTKEIQIHINSLTAIKEFCQRRAVTTALQQTIANNRSEADEKMSTSKVIDRIIEWANLPQQEYKASEEDYIKMLLLSYMVNSFWFFQRKIINACLEGQRKAQIVAYCKKVQNTCKPLKEKQQGAERYDLYRHQPAIIAEIDDWLSNKKEFECTSVNKSSANRQSRYIIVIDGALGYNEACFIQRYLKERQQKVDVTIFCQRLVTTKDYLNLLLKNSGRQD